MKAVLEEKKDYPYLLTNAKARLLQARDTSARSFVTAKPLVNIGGRMYCIFPWLGTYSFLAMERFLKIRCADRLGLKGFISLRPYYMQFTMAVSEDEFYKIMSEELEKPMDPMELVYPKEVPVFDKYDDMLPEELVKKGFAYGVLNIEEMKNCIRGWISGRREL